MKKGNRMKYIEALLNIRNPTRPKRKQGGIENSSNMKGSGATVFWGESPPPPPSCNYSKVGKSCWSSAVVQSPPLFLIP